MSAIRRLWLVLGSVVTVGVLAFAVLNVVSLLGRDQRSDHTTVAAEGVTSLHVDNENGSVRVVGADVATIDVRAEIGDGMRRTIYETRRDGDTFVVKGECPFVLPAWCEVDLVVTVPRGLPVRIDADDGRVDVRHLDGPLEVDANNGRVELADLGGDLEVDHDDGRLFATDLRSAVVVVGGTNGRISLGFSRPPTTVRARTFHGHVEVVLPDSGDAYRVQTDNRHGTEEVGVPTDPASPRSIDLSTVTGDITVRHPEPAP